MSPHVRDNGSASAMELLSTPGFRKALKEAAVVASRRVGADPLENLNALRDATRLVHQTSPQRTTQPLLDFYSGTWVRREDPAVNTLIDIAVAIDERDAAAVQKKLRRMTRTELEAALIAAARTIPLDAPASLLWPCTEDRG